MDFTTDAVKLSLRNAETGKALTANVYNVVFDDGSSRVMSVGQLVMAICLARATEKEKAVVDIMDGMAVTTTNIEALSDVEAKIVDKNSAELSKITGNWSVVRNDGTTAICTTADEVLSALGVDIGTTVDTIIDNIETKLDTLNTTSQEQMINLQSQTNKRDQSYEMISNVLKSFYTVMSGIVNNV